MKKLNRRSFFWQTLTTAFLASTAKASSPKLVVSKEKSEFTPAAFFPLQEFENTQFSTPQFNGEDIDRPHEVLWDLDNYIAKKGGIPSPNEDYDVVIVGGGIAGLSAAHFLKDKKVLILEEQERLGGNAKGEKWKGDAYSQGAAYIGEVDEGGPTASFFQEIGLDLNEARVDVPSDMNVFYKEKIVSGLFTGEITPEESQKMKDVISFLNKTYEENYPDMPYVEDGMDRESFNKLDKISLLEWFQKNIPDRPVLFDEFITQYCWSSFNADWDEISAAQGLNFILSDLQKTHVFPGGNSYISQAITEALLKSINPPTIKSKCFVCKIQEKDNQVIVTYDGPDRKLYSVSSRVCILATQKKFTKHIISNLGSEQSYAMDRISYRSYLVANVLLKKKINSNGYDIFSLKGKVPESARRDIDSRYATDFIFAGWAKHDLSEKSILTFYIPRSFQGAEQFLFSPMAHQKYKDKLIALLPEILSSLGLNLDDVEGIRMTRWGHALPIAKVGMISSGILEVAHAPINNKIFFAHQDNWANPCFETAFNSARLVSLQIKKILE